MGTGAHRVGRVTVAGGAGATRRRRVSLNARARVIADWLVARLPTALAVLSVGTATAASVLAVIASWAGAKEPGPALIFWAAVCSVAAALSGAGAGALNRRQLTDKVHEAGDVLTALSRGLSPVLRALGDMQFLPVSDRAPGLTRVVDEVVATRAVLYKNLDGVRMVVYRIHVGRTRAPDRLTVDNWSGRPENRPQPFVDRDKGRGQAAFKWLRSGEPYKFCPDTSQEQDPDWKGSGNGYRTYISIPLRVGDTTYGMLTVDAPDPGDLLQTDIPVLQVIAQAMAIGYQTETI